jgi:hypothetical protein
MTGFMVGLEFKLGGKKEPSQTTWFAKKAYLKWIEADSIQKSVPVATK